MFVPLSKIGDDVEQGSELWFQKRKHKMTGSKPSSIMFECKDELSYQNMWDIVFGNAKPPPFDEKQQAAVDWGSTMEDHACEQFYKTLPGTIVFETSIIDHPTYNWIAASPDGYIVRVKTENGQIVQPMQVEERAAFEIKCPGSNLRDSNGKPCPYQMAKNLKKKKNPPYYYMTQLHFEMVALGTPVTYFYMWTPWFSKVWKVDFDHSYWRETMEVLSAFKHKIVPWCVLKSKIDAWINMSKAIARKYTTIHEWDHTPKPSIPIHPWYTPFEKEWIQKIHE